MSRAPENSRPFTNSYDIINPGVAAAQVDRYRRGVSKLFPLGEWLMCRGWLIYGDAILGLYFDNLRVLFSLPVWLLRAF